jgi:hypothetical protein
MCYLSLLQISNLDEATFNDLKCPLGRFAGLKHRQVLNYCMMSTMRCLKLEALWLLTCKENICSSMKFVWSSSFWHVLIMFRIVLIRGNFFCRSLLMLIIALSHAYISLLFWWLCLYGILIVCLCTKSTGFVAVCPQNWRFLDWATKPRPKARQAEMGSGRTWKLQGGGHAVWCVSARREYPLLDQSDPKGSVSSI